MPSIAPSKQPRHRCAVHMWYTVWHGPESWTHTSSTQHANVTSSSDPQALVLSLQPDFPLV